VNGVISIQDVRISRFSFSTKSWSISSFSGGNARFGAAKLAFGSNIVMWSGIPVTGPAIDVMCYYNTLSFTTHLTYVATSSVPSRTGASIVYLANLNAMVVFGAFY
jgi:hypothetical protein